MKKHSKIVCIGVDAGDKDLILQWVQEGVLPTFRRLLFSEHHRSHAASAFFPSPFERAAVLAWTGWANGRRVRFGSGKVTV
jgi:predicted NodU family carbamoyl transferase